MTQSKLLLGAGLVLALSLNGCFTFDRDLTEAKLKRICKEYCQKEEPGVYMLVNKKWSADLGGGGSFKNATGSIWVQTPDGWLESPHKGAKLNPDCFSKEPLSTNNGEGVPKLALLDLTHTNTTIMLLNFTKDGRLESRELSDLSGPQSVAVKADIDTILGSPPSNGTIEYEEVRDLLSTLDGGNFVGRPAAGQIDVQGFNKRNISLVPDDKTPFFTKVGNPGGANSREHAFFYVLLDEHLKFNRNTAAMISYGPAAQNDVGHLYTPYIQYEIAPTQLVATYPSYPLYPLQTQNVEVMPVHFLRENMAEDIPREGEGAKCSYPYDLGVIAEGQMGVGQPDTPLMIDPETETDGPPILYH